MPRLSQQEKLMNRVKKIGPSRVKSSRLRKLKIPRTDH